MADFGHKLACRLLINRVRVLGSGPHTHTHVFLGVFPPGEINLVLSTISNKISFACGANVSAVKTL